MYVAIGTLHQGDGTTTRDVVLHLRDGRVVSVGSEAPPAGASVHRFPDGHGTPGWVDAATRLGVKGGAVEASEVLTPGVRASDAFDGGSAALRGVARHGVTTVGLLPAPGNLAAGRAGAASLFGDQATISLRSGPPVFAFQAPALSVNRVPSTLAGARLLLSAALRGEPWHTPAEAAVPVRDTALRRLKALPAGPALAYADTPEAARTAVEVLTKKDLRPTLVGLASASDDPAAVAALKVPCIVTGLSAGSSIQRLSLPGVLAKAGATVSLSSGAPDRSAAALRTALALAVAHGLPVKQAVRAVTGAPAKALGLAKSVGSLEAGCEADLVVFSGDPWELTSRILLVVADGRIVVAPADKEKP
jgi:imidazolonepropionase-like amidohydrolase